MAAAGEAAIGQLDMLNTSLSQRLASETGFCVGRVGLVVLWSVCQSECWVVLMATSALGCMA